MSKAANLYDNNQFVIEFRMFGKVWWLGENYIDKLLVFNPEAINDAIFASYKNNGHVRGA